MSLSHGIAARFSRAAETYTQAAAVQRELVELLAGKLPDSNPKRILEIGCGTGMLTDALLKKYPQAKIDAVDIAAGMIDFCRRKFSSAVQVQWHEADILTFDFPQPYDLVVSASAIHWVADLDALFTKLRAALSDSGAVVFSLMLEHTFRELQEAKRAVLTEGKIGTRLPSFERVADSVEQAGFRISEGQCFCRTVPYGSARDFFRDLHAQGVTSGSVSRSDTPLSRGELKQLARAYEQQFRREEGGVTATYECGLFFARQI